MKTRQRQKIKIILSPKSIYFDEDADATKKKKIKANLLKQNRGIILTDMKQTYDTTTKEMDFELCNLIDDVG